MKKILAIFSIALIGALTLTSCGVLGKIRDKIDGKTSTVEPTSTEEN